jgi:hypothetical protein
MMTYRGVEVTLHAFYTSAVVSFTVWPLNSRYPFGRISEDPQSHFVRDGKRKMSVPAGNGILAV